MPNWDRRNHHWGVLIKLQNLFSGSGDLRRVSRACWGYCFPFLVAEQGQAEPHRHVWHTHLPLMVSMCSKICYSARVSKGGIKLSGGSKGCE